MVPQATRTPIVWENMVLRDNFWQFWAIFEVLLFNSFFWRSKHKIWGQKLSFNPRSAIYWLCDLSEPPNLSKAYGFLSEFNKLICVKGEELCPWMALSLQNWVEFQSAAWLDVYLALAYWEIRIRPSVHLMSYRCYPKRSSEPWGILLWFILAQLRAPSRTFSMLVALASNGQDLGTPSLFTYDSQSLDISGVVPSACKMSLLSSQFSEQQGQSQKLWTPVFC
jgi:hypothetical protein